METKSTKTQKKCPVCGEVNNVTQGNVVDNGGFLWGLLGCCVPVAGLVLFLVWKDTKPKTAKATGIGALFNVAVCVLWYVLLIFAGIGMSFI